MSMPGMWEIVVLVILALLIFGPERLPGMARNAGRMYAQLKREAGATLDELRKAAELDELKSVRDELRAAGRDVAAAGREITGAATDATSAITSPAARQRRTLPAPFDPDTT